MSEAGKSAAGGDLPLWIGLAAFLVVGCVLFPAGGVDDAHITYLAARRFAETFALVNGNGEAVEQSSSLLSVVVLGSAHRLTGIGIPTLGWWLGIAGGLLSLGLAGRLAARLGAGRTGLVALGLAHPLVYWSFSGMETGLVAACGTGWVLALASAGDSTPRARRFGSLLVATLLSVLARPEGSAVVVAVLLGQSVLRGRRATLAMAWSSAALCVLGLAAFRLAHSGHALPQTVLAKSSRGLTETVPQGFAYLARPGTWFLVAAALCAVPRVVAREASPARVVAGLYCCAQLGFVVASGGDWMEGARFAAHSLPVAVVFLASALEPLLTQRVAAVLLTLAAAAGTLSFAREDSKSLVVWAEPELAYTGGPELAFAERKNKVHLRDAPTLAALDPIVTHLAPTRDAPLRIWTGQGGFVLYHLHARHPGALDVTDRYGLLDARLSRSPTACAAGRGSLGLKLGWPYLLEHWDAILAESGLDAPDLVFDVGIGGRGAQGLAQRGYVEVYEQQGVVKSGSSLFPGFLQPARQRVFLRRELAERLPPERLTSFRFSRGPYD